MRNMSFSITTRQIKERTKTVTRRLGWRCLNPGDLICAVAKGMGLKRGERVERLAVLWVKSIREEALDAITPEDVALEGFPGMSPAAFVEMFCRGHQCVEWELVRRIEFEYGDVPATAVKESI